MLLQIRICQLCGAESINTPSGNWANTALPEPVMRGLNPKEASH
jgi:hypothetical protein